MAELSVKERWPFVPVVELVNGRAGYEQSDSEIARQLGIPRGSVSRYKRGGLTEKAADAIACRLGTHPILLWPHEYRILQMAP